MSAGRLPGLWGGLGILCGLMLAEVLLYVLLEGPFGALGMDDASQLGIITAGSNLLVLSVVLRRAGLDWGSLFHAGSASPRAVVVVLALPVAAVVVGANWWLADLLDRLIERFPVSDEEMEALGEIMGAGAASLLVVGLLAPVLEEMLFRGVLLRGFLQHYPPGAAIGLSALVFAVFHFTLSQLPVALLFGLFAGWLYWRTRSLWPCILAHVLFNSTAVVRFASEQRLHHVSPELVGGAGATLANVSSFVVSAIGLHVLWHLLHGRRR